MWWWMVWEWHSPNDWTAAGESRMISVLFDLLLSQMYEDNYWSIMFGRFRVKFRVETTIHFWKRHKACQRGAVCFIRLSQKTPCRHERGMLFGQISDFLPVKWCVIRIKQTEYECYCSAEANLSSWWYRWNKCVLITCMLETECASVLYVGLTRNDELWETLSVMHKQVRIIKRSSL